MDKSVSKFKRWAKRESYGRGLICHFYITQPKDTEQKQYYGKDDYAHFNLLSPSRDWIVKGTPGHGIKSRRGHASSVPCLNCFEVDDRFYDGLEQLAKEGNPRFEFGIVFNKRKLKNMFNVIDVSIERPNPLPPPNECHHYDNPRFRSGVLNPFNYCYVVRLEIRNDRNLGSPLAVIPYRIIECVLVKRGQKNQIKRMLKAKKMQDVRVFSVL